MKKETKVNCEVENCKYNEENRCNLDELDIGSICGDDCEEIEDTICNSFEKEDNTDDDCKEVEYEDLENEEEIEEVEDDDFDDDYDDELEEDIESEKEEYIKIEEDF